MKFIKHISILFLALATTVGCAQDEADVTFEVYSNTTQFGIKGNLKVDFETNIDEDNFVPPSFQDFVVVGGPIKSINNKWINGVRSYSKTYTYIIKPKKIGDLVIKEATINVDGVEYKTNSFIIKVLENKQNVKTQKIASDSLINHINIVAEVSKNNLKLKDSLYVTYSIYVSHSIGLSSFEEDKKPTYKNCDTKNINLSEFNFENAKFKGENFRKMIVRQTLLKPLKVGVLKINPTTFKVLVDVPNGKKGFLGEDSFEPQTVTLKSNQVLVKVSE